MNAYQCVADGADDEHDAVGDHVEKQTSVELELPLQRRQVGQLSVTRRDVGVVERRRHRRGAQFEERGSCDALVVHPCLESIFPIQI